MHHGTCHCGTVSFELSDSPEILIDCNWSICRRIGALWGHVPITAVTITAEPDSTLAYVQGDKMLAMHSCKTCGCNTHWESLTEEGQHMAVNFRMCGPVELENFTIRKFDGANTWEFLD